MSEVDISEALPNGHETDYTQQHSVNSVGVSEDESNNCSQDDGHSEISAEQVFVATSHGLFTSDLQEAAQIKTTHIVIHDETLDTPNTPLPPPTPATPLSKEKGFKYQWDDSVHADRLPVRCKTTNGEFYKSKFGSGGRGRCILSGDRWFTPNEFESYAGRASSKDWKRSIRYGGRTLHCLIEDGILHCHATSCTCASCCDDESVTGPVRLFVPYKRRKKDSEMDPGSPNSKKLKVNPKPGSQNPNAIVVTVAGTPHTARPISVTNTENGETVQIVTTDSAGNIVTGDAMVMAALPIATKGGQQATVATMDVNEQKQWWQLEEMANSLMQQAQSLKTMIEHAKHQSLLTKETALQQMRMTMEREKQEALNSARIEAQMTLTRTVMEERAQKDVALQQAIAQARAEMQEKMDSVTVVAGDKVTTYNVTWTQDEGEANIDRIIDATEEEAEKEK